MPGPRVVGYFIVVKARALQRLADEPVLAKLFAVIDFRNLPRVAPQSQRGAVLKRQAVHRQVFRTERERPLQVALDHAARHGEHQIQAYVDESFRAQQANALLGLPPGMKAPQELERAVVERLHAERHPVDPGAPQHLRLLRVQRSGIGLAGPFRHAA